jgi:hypothetical protein
MYIENTENNQVSEAALFDHYANYFPDLNLRAKFIEDAYRARFVSYSNGVEKEIYTQRVSKAESNVHVSAPTVNIPVPSHSVFEGWSLVKPTGNYEIDSQYILSATELAKYYFGEAVANNIYVAPEFVFYAIYNREAYEIKFKDINTIPGETDIFDVMYIRLYGDSI